MFLFFKKKQYLFSFLIIASPLASCGAGMEWLDENINISIVDTVDAFSFSVDFQNKSNDTLIVDEITTSCGCTLMEINKKRYLANEKGTLNGLFRVNNKRGKQYVKIDLVWRSDSDLSSRREKITNQVEINIIELIKVSPSILIWRDSKDLAPKRATVIVSQGSLRELTISEFKSPSFSIDLMEKQKGSLFEIEIKPLEDFSQSIARLKLSGLMDGGEVINQYIHLIRR